MFFLNGNKIICSDKKLFKHPKYNIIIDDECNFFNFNIVEDSDKVNKFITKQDFEDLINTKTIDEISDILNIAIYKSHNGKFFLIGAMEDGIDMQTKKCFSAHFKRVDNHLDYHITYEDKCLIIGYNELNRLEYVKGNKDERHMNILDIESDISIFKKYNAKYLLCSYHNSVEPVFGICKDLKISFSCNNMCFFPMDSKVFYSVYDGKIIEHNSKLYYFCNDILEEIKFSEFIPMVEYKGNIDNISDFNIRYDDVIYDCDNKCILELDHVNKTITKTYDNIEDTHSRNVVLFYNKDSIIKTYKINA